MFHLGSGGGSGDNAAPNPDNFTFGGSVSTMDADGATKQTDEEVSDLLFMQQCLLCI